MGHLDQRTHSTLLRVGVARAVARGTILVLAQRTIVRGTTVAAFGTCLDIAASRPTTHVAIFVRTGRARVGIRSSVPTQGATYCCFMSRMKNIWEIKKIHQ